MTYEKNVSKLDRLIEDKRQKMIDSGMENGYLNSITVKLSKKLDDLLNLKNKLGEKKNGGKYDSYKRKVIG